MELIDLTGKIFGNLEVLEKGEKIYPVKEIEDENEECDWDI